MKAFDELCRRTTRAIVRYRMIGENDRILIGLSGGKDSMALAHVLHEIRRRSPVKFDLVCATFDPGFPEFGLAEIERYAKSRNWDFHTVSLPIAEVMEEKHFQKTPCVLCSRLRRGKLNGLCRQLNCTKLALAQHFDDIAASFLMSLCRGQGLTTMGPHVPAQSANTVTLIRPFALAAEELICHVREELQFPVAGKCRYEENLQNGDRIYFRNLLNDLSKRIPNLRSQMMQSLGNLQAEFLLDEKFMPFLNAGTPSSKEN